MPLTPGEEARQELQVATYKLISAVMREEQALETRKTTSEERTQLHSDVEQAYRRRVQVIAKLNVLPEGW